MAKITKVETSLEAYLKVELEVSYEDMQIAQMADPTSLGLGTDSEHFQVILGKEADPTLDKVALPKPKDVAKPYSFFIEFDAEDTSERVGNAIIKILSEKLNDVESQVQAILEYLETPVSEQMPDEEEED